MAFSGVALYSITEEALFPALAFLIGALDNLLIALVSKSYPTLVFRRQLPKSLILWCGIDDVNED